MLRYACSVHSPGAAHMHTITPDRFVSAGFLQYPVPAVCYSCSTGLCDMGAGNLGGLGRGGQTRTPNAAHGTARIPMVMCCSCARSNLPGQAYTRVPSRLTAMQSNRHDGRNGHRRPYTLVLITTADSLSWGVATVGLSLRAVAPPLQPPLLPPTECPWPRLLLRTARWVQSGASASA